MKDHVGVLPLSRICRLFGVARSSVYHRPVEKEPVDLEPLKELVRTLLVSFPRTGVRKMWHYLVRYYTRYSRKQLRQAYLELGLLRKTHPRKPRTTDSRFTENRFPDRVKGLSPERVHQVWVGDVTCFRIGSRFVHLALLMDAYSRMILGWALDSSNDGRLARRALEMALEYGNPEIHHTDQGAPYGSTRYLEILRKAGALSSMSEAGKPEDNGKAERLNRTIKEEEIQISEYRNLAEAELAIQEYVQRYNNLRIHQALRYKTPKEVYKEKN